ncbi:zinc finger BED domain-containing protein RICESLEEPER 2-like [Senna tora]|uniref:Zinc finger BED domain-containing protein RICESLEEPER 2-like n=1 Tax=Senna tora TaxID=362788 RepID=A0A834W7B9_9FABA|nr:zinc finger BED domain-containing protein RICESLEEPER 2-like [Senna tora]
MSAIQESRDEEERVAKEERQRTSLPASLPTPTPVSTPSTHGSNAADTLTSSQTAPLSEEGVTQFAGGKRKRSEVWNHMVKEKKLDKTLRFVITVRLSLVQKDGSMDLKNFNFDPKVSRRDFAEAIIFYEYPLAMADHIKFRKFISNLQPLFKMVTRNTIKSDVLKIHETATERKKKGYMSLIAHFIDDNWRLQSLLLRFLYVPTPHTMDVLANTLLKGGRTIQMRCCAHILNLIVEDGLSIIDEAIETIRDSVAYWIATPSREALGKWMQPTDATIKDMTTKMLSKFDKYWGVASIVMAVAVILDPRYKLKVVEYYFPISTVASESAFSTSGRVVSPHRSSLEDGILEALMCTQNWMHYEEALSTLKPSVILSWLDDEDDHDFGDYDEE